MQLVAVFDRGSTRDLAGTLSMKKSQQLSVVSSNPVAFTSVLTELQKFSLSSCNPSINVTHCISYLITLHGRLPACYDAPTAVLSQTLL